MSHVETIIELTKQDRVRLDALDCVFELSLPQCYLAAGFVRNLVWDHLHQKPKPTHLNDVDVIYFDPDEFHEQAYLAHEEKVKTMMPHLNWQVRNQAQMHRRNHDKPYISTLEAMSHWPEKETAVGIRKNIQGEYECISAFGFDSLFSLQITHNPKRNRDVFEHRVYSKNWLVQWPKLNISQ